MLNLTLIAKMLNIKLFFFIPKSFALVRWDSAEKIYSTGGYINEKRLRTRVLLYHVQPGIVA